MHPKSTAKIIRSCLVCGKEFSPVRYHVERGNGRFCSRRCARIDQAKSWSRPPLKCEHCGIEFPWKLVHGNPQRFCSPRCLGLSRRTGGVNDQGYVVVVGGDGRKVKAHRLVMEQHLGRKLRRDEVVHHIDGNRANNDVSNLVVMTAEEHDRLHRARR